MHFPLPQPDVSAAFKRRLNRFLGVAEVEGEEVLVHIHDPGRLAELLFPGSTVWLRRKAGGKAPYYLLAVELPEELVLVDSAMHNKIAVWLVEEGHVFKGYSVAKTEPSYGRGRFDLLLRRPDGGLALVEVKGVTLEVDGVALFPDAPTARGARHMEELARAAAEGYEAHVLFLVLRRRARLFSPNWALDAKFAEALAKAADAGVKIAAVKLEMFKWGLLYRGTIEVQPGRVYTPRRP